MSLHYFNVKFIGQTWFGLLPSPWISFAKSSVSGQKTNQFFAAAVVFGVHARQFRFASSVFPFPVNAVTGCRVVFVVRSSFHALFPHPMCRSASPAWRLWANKGGVCYGTIRPPSSLRQSEKAIAWPTQRTRRSVVADEVRTAEHGLFNDGVDYNMWQTVSVLPRQTGRQGRTRYMRARQKPSRFRQLVYVLVFGLPGDYASDTEESRT